MSLVHDNDSGRRTYSPRSRRESKNSRGDDGQMWFRDEDDPDYPQEGLPSFSPGIPSNSSHTLPETPTRTDPPDSKH